MVLAFLRATGQNPLGMAYEIVYMGGAMLAVNLTNMYIAGPLTGLMPAQVGMWTQPIVQGLQDGLKMVVAKYY